MNKDKVKYREKQLWGKAYDATYQRCNNANAKPYKYYGGRGIELLMTIKDFKFLWFRDKAYLMKRPSIDRKDNRGHYIKSNCRYIELSTNISRNKIGIPRKISDRKRIGRTLSRFYYNHPELLAKITQYTRESKFIKNWVGLRKTAKMLNIRNNSIANCLVGRTETAGGYRWEYTEKIKV